MGVSWLTEIISFWVDGEFENWIFSDILNILTGPFVSVIIVYRPKVWKLLISRFRTSCLATPTAADPPSCTNFVETNFCTPLSNDP